MRGRELLTAWAQSQTSTWAQTLALLFAKCVTLGKSLNLSVPQFLHKARLMIVPTSLGCYDDLKC